MNVKEYQAAYRAAHREKARKTAAEWRANNKEREKAMTAAYREANREVLRERYRANYEKHKEKRKALSAEVKRRNRPKYRVYNQNRKRAMAGSLSSGIVQVLMEAQAGKCVYCVMVLGDGYHIDHITPISRGGKNVDANVQLLCAPCNLRKNAMTHEEFMARLRK